MLYLKFRLQKNESVYFTQIGTLIGTRCAEGISRTTSCFFDFTWGICVPGFIFVYGNTGLGLFFILSGFVIFMSLPNSNGIKEFVINRICRLYPTYWASVSFPYILATSIATNIPLISKNLCGMIISSISVCFSFILMHQMLTSHIGPGLLN